MHFWFIRENGKIIFKKRTILDLFCFFWFCHRKLFFWSWFWNQEQKSFASFETCKLIMDYPLKRGPFFLNVIVIFHSITHTYCIWLTLAFWLPFKYLLNHIANYVGHFCMRTHSSGVAAVTTQKFQFQKNPTLSLMLTWHNFGVSSDYFLFPCMPT